MVNSQIFITSINKAINRAKVTGTFNLTILSIVNLYIYYIDYTSQLIALGMAFKDENKQLKEDLLKLKYKYPSIICNYKNIIPVNNEVLSGTNTPPTVDNNTIDMDVNPDYTFTVADFTVNYTDAEAEGYKYLLINPITSPVEGVLSSGGVEVTSPIVINIEGLLGPTAIDLKYTRVDELAFATESFNFRVSDNPLNYLYSTIATMGMFSNAVVPGENLPPDDIGDITLYVGNQVTTILTLSMFTSQLNPPYNDPEGDLIDAIRIVDISNANDGTFYYNSVEIVDGQIITREQINTGLFTHEGPAQDTIASDVFEFEARDEGSQTWVG